VAIAEGPERDISVLSETISARTGLIGIIGTICLIVGAIRRLFGEDIRWRV
jgi:hypothetical protein